MVDVMLPTARLVKVLDAFRTRFPTVSLRLHVEALGAVTQLILDGTANIGVSGPLFYNTDELELRRIGAVKLVPVAAPTHLLSRYKGRSTLAEARKHIQLVLTDRSSLTKDKEFGVIGTRTWRLADLGAKHALLLAGIGWGSMPESMVCDDLASRRLTKLDLDVWDSAMYPLQVVHRTDAPPGPSARWMVEQLAVALASS